MTNRPSYARFYRAFALSAVLAAAITGLAATLHFAWGLRGFGGLEYLPRVVALSAAREYAPGVVFGMSLFAWVVQTHGWDGATTRVHFRALAWRSATSALLGYLPCLGIMVAVSVALSGFLYDTDARQFLQSVRSTLTPTDVLHGLGSSLLDLVPLLLICYFAMPRLAASGWRLWTKLLLLWAGLGALGLLAELLVAAFALAQT